MCPPRRRGTAEQEDDAVHHSGRGASASRRHWSHRTPHVGFRIVLLATRQTVAAGAVATKHVDPPVEGRHVRHEAAHGHRCYFNPGVRCRVVRLHGREVSLRGAVTTDGVDPPVEGDATTHVTLVQHRGLGRPDVRGGVVLVVRPPRDVAPERVDLPVEDGCARADCPHGQRRPHSPRVRGGVVLVDGIRIGPTAVVARDDVDLPVKRYGRTRGAWVLHRPLHYPGVSGRVVFLDVHDGTVPRPPPADLVDLAVHRRGHAAPGLPHGALRLPRAPALGFDACRQRQTTTREQHGSHAPPRSAVSDRWGFPLADRFRRNCGGQDAGGRILLVGARSSLFLCLCARGVNQQCRPVETDRHPRSSRPIHELHRASRR